MTTINSYRDLKVWQGSMVLVDLCFEIVEALPRKYFFVFCDQLLPASISIPANIAEGSRRTRKGYITHLSYSLGSQAEVETILQVIARRNLVPPSLTGKASQSCESIGRLLHGLSSSLKRGSGAAAPK